MLVSDIITRVRKIAGDTDVNQFDDATIMAWINDGMRECAINNNLFQVEATQNTVIGTNQYSLPSDIAKLHSVKYDNVKLPDMTLQEFDEQFTTDGTDRGTPVNYVIWAGKIKLYPVPDAIKTLTIDYIRQPTEVTAVGNTPELPPIYHLRLVDYCLAQVAQQDDDLQRYQMKMDEFRTGVQSIQDKDEVNVDAYPHMSVSSRDMGDGYYDYE
jgi:hypothetical protein